MIANILAELHIRYPKLDFSQYKGVLADRSIVYAESVMNFEKDCYLELGITEGAFGPFMKGIGRALHCKKKGKKCMKFDIKEY